MKKENTNTKVFKLARERLFYHHLLILEAILPQGAVCKEYYIAHNITRPDGSIASIQYDLMSGKWLDFDSESDAKGSDIISLHAHLNGTRQKESLVKLVLLVGAHLTSERTRTLKDKLSIHLVKDSTKFGGE